MAMGTFAFLYFVHLYLSSTEPPLGKSNMAAHAVDEREFAYTPAYWFNRMLLYISRVIQQRDVRGEIRTCPPPQTAAHHRCRKLLPKQPEALHSVASYQHKRMIAWFAPEAKSAVEGNVERPHPHSRRSLVCSPQKMLWQTAQRK
jgi:hypothetical protein